MADIPAIPPVPEAREARYEWVETVRALGLKVGRACDLAGVPRISYQKWRQKKTAGAGAKSEAPGATPGGSGNARTTSTTTDKGSAGSPYDTLTDDESQGAA